MSFNNTHTVQLTEISRNPAAQRNSMHISYKSNSPNRSRNRGSAGKDSFTPSCKVCHCAGLHETHACLTTFCKELLN
jgi:cytochrome c5